MSNDIKLDWQTVAYLKHLFAGKLSNINGGSKMIIEGKNKLSDGTNIAEIIYRDGTSIKDILVKLEKELNQVN